MKREKKRRKEKEEERGKEKEKGEREKEKKKEKGNKKENEKNKRSAEDESMEEGSIEDEEYNIDLPFANEREVKEFINSISKGYAKYFDITFKKNRVSDEAMPSVIIKRNNEEIEKALMKKGRMILITNNNNLKEKGKKEVLYLYRKRNDVERVFNALKNKIDGNRLRTHSSDTTSGKLFILFIALILYSALDKLMKENNLYEKYTMNELLEMMKNIRTLELKSGPIFLTEIPKKAKDVFKLFNIELPQYA
jgi:transposase